MANAEKLKKGDGEGLYAQANALVELTGLSVTKACARVGLYLRSYYYWHDKKKKAPAGTGAKRDTQETGATQFNTNDSTPVSASGGEPQTGGA